MVCRWCRRLGSPGGGGGNAGGHGGDGGGAVSLWVLVMVPVVLLVAVAAMAVPQRLAAESSLRGAASDLGEVAVAAESGGVAFDEVNGVLGLRLDETECAGGAAVAPAGQAAAVDPKRLAVSEVVCAALLDVGSGGVSWDSVDGYYSGVVPGAVAVDGGRWLLCEGDGAEAVYVSVVADWAEAGWAASQVWPDGVRLGAEGLVLGGGSGLSDAGADCSWARDGVDLQHAVARYPLRDELATAAQHQPGQPPTTPAATTTTTVPGATTTVPGSGSPLPVSAGRWKAHRLGYSELYFEDPSLEAFRPFDFDVHFNGPVPNVPDPGHMVLEFWDQSDAKRLGGEPKNFAKRGASCADKSVDFVAPRKKTVRLEPGATMQWIFKPGEVEICYQDGYEPGKQRFLADFRVYTTFDTDPKSRSNYQRFKNRKLNFFSIYEYRILEPTRVTADCSSGRQAGGRKVGEGTTITCRFRDGAGKEIHNRFIAVSVHGKEDNLTDVIPTPQSPKWDPKTPVKGSPYFDVAVRGNGSGCPAIPRIDKSGSAASEVDFVVPADGMARGAPPPGWYPPSKVLVLSQLTIPIDVERWDSGGSMVNGIVFDTHTRFGPSDFSSIDMPASSLSGRDAQSELERDLRPYYPVTTGEFSFHRGAEAWLKRPEHRLQIKICDNDGEYHEDDRITDETHDHYYKNTLREPYDAYVDFGHDQHVGDRKDEVLRVWYTAISMFVDPCTWARISKDSRAQECRHEMLSPETGWQYKILEYQPRGRITRWGHPSTQPGHTCDKPYVDRHGIEWKCIEFTIVDDKPTKPKKTP